MTGNIRISARNATFQQWQALLANRHKRQRSCEFLVQGVRPITLAIAHHWPLHTLIYDADRVLSRWANDTLDTVTTQRVAMTTELIAELGEKPAEPPELVAVAEMPPDDFGRVNVTGTFLGLVFDRPSTPGNIGTLIRSADAFGAGCLIVTGHAADPYDPKSVRASTGSIFALPVIRAASVQEVIAWSRPLTIAGTDENGTVAIAGYDLTRPTLLAVGNERTGLSAAWREACDVLLKIPIMGSASSLNAATAGTIALYEAARQRQAIASGVAAPDGRQPGG